MRRARARAHALVPRLLLLFGLACGGEAFTTSRAGAAPAPPAGVGAAPPAVAAARIQSLASAWAAALGGVEALRGIEAVHQVGVVEGHGVSGDLDEWQTSDGRHRQFIDFLGRWNVLTVFDGTRGWSVDEGGVRHVLRGRDLAGEATDAWLAALAWLFPERRAGALEYGGTGAGGREERLVARPAHGLPVTLVFDASGGLPLRLETPEGDKTRVIVPLDWRRVGDVLFPFGYRQSTGDIRDDVSIVLREVRLNEAPPADAFTAPPGPPPDVRFAAEGRTRLDVAVALARIFIPVLVDGRGPFTFILDTAATRSTMSEAVAQAGALAITMDTTGVAAGDAPRAGRRFGRVGQLQLGDATWSDARLEVEPLDALSQSAGRRVDGRLGVDFLTRFVVEFEPGKARLTLADPELFEAPRGTRVIPLRLVKGLPTLIARLGDRLDARLLLRTGMRFPLIFSAGLGPALDLAPGAPGTRAAPLVTPAAGASLLTLGRVASFDFAGTGADDPAVGPRLRDVPAAILPPGEALPVGADVVGLLGGEVLNRCHWYMDLPREELRLDPDALDTAPFLQDCAGMALRAELPVFDVFVVDWVMPGGPAALAGLLPGDRLEALDGHAAAELRLEGLVEGLSKPGKRVHLTFTRDGKSRNLVLKLRLLS